MCGVTAIVRSDLPAAFGHFEDFATWQDLPRLGGSALQGARTCKTLQASADVAATSLPFQLSDIAWFGSPPSERNEGLDVASHSIIFAGDPIYTRAFGPNLVSSLSRHARRAQHVHFHVVARKVQDPRGWLVPPESCSNVMVTASVEKVPVTDRTYFACARFVRAADIVTRLRRRCVFLDLDSEFVDDPGSHVEDLPPNSVGVFVGHPAGSGFFPWTQIMAGALVLPETRVGISYAQLLRAAIGYLWAGPERSRWWIDQAALALSTYLTQSYSSTCTITRLAARHLRCCDTGAHIKVKCLQFIPEIRLQMDRGVPLLQALRHVQAQSERTPPGGDPGESTTSAARDGD